MRPNKKTVYCSVRCYNAHRRKAYRAAHAQQHRKAEARRQAARRKSDPVFAEKQRALVRRWHRIRTYGYDPGDNPLNHHRDRYRHARAVGKRSGLEVSVCAGLDAEGVPYHYEPFDIPYVPLKERRYKPDLVLDNGIILELKGFFKTEDRTKHLNVRHNHPDLDIRFVFSNPETRIGKKSQTTYRQWCVTKGFKFCKATEFPRSWLKEPVNQKSLAAIEVLWEQHKAKKK